MDQHGDAALQVVIHAMESLAKVLMNVAALGLYSLAGLVLLPVVFATLGWRWLCAPVEWIQFPSTSLRTGYSHRGCLYFRIISKF